MAAITMWDIITGNRQALNAPETPIYSPPPPPAYDPYSARPAFKPASESTKTVAELEQEERDRKKAAVEEANTPETLDKRSQDVITGLYGGGPGSRVLTEDEFYNGWTDALGNYRQGTPRETRTEEELAAIRYRNLSHDWYKSGMDHFTGSRDIGENDFGDNIHVYGNGDIYDEAMAYVREVYGTPAGKGVMAPWMNTYDKDRFGTYNLVRGSDYNAFLGNHGRRQSNVDGYRDDSIAGYFKNAFAGQDQIKNRSDAIRSLRQWNEVEGGRGVGLNKATEVMTKQYFDQMDLANKFGLTWEQAGAVVNQNQGAGTNQNYNESGGSPVNPGNAYVADNEPNLGNGMLSHQNSSWLDVLGRGGAQNWDSLLGQYTYGTPLDWASMDNQTVQTEFSELFDTGGMFTQGKNRDLIYAKLMENMGRV